MLTAAALIASDAWGQFTTVINLPSDPLPAVLGSDTQVNIFEGANLSIPGFGDHLGKVQNQEINLLGGVLGQPQFDQGSTFNLSDGFIRFVRLRPGVSMTMTGGVTVAGISAPAGSSVSISAADLRINGQPIAGLEAAGASLQIDLPTQYILTGAFADGSPLFIRSTNGDIAAGTLSVHAIASPANPRSLIVASLDPVPTTIGDLQTLRVDSGAALPANFQATAGSELIIEPGGAVGNNARFYGAEVTLLGSPIASAGGTLGNFAYAHTGSNVAIEGGTVGVEFYATVGSTVNIRDGSVGDRFRAGGGSVVNISGGAVGKTFDGQAGSVVNISGGWVNEGLTTHGTLNFSGGTIRDDASALSDSVFTMSGGTIGEDFAARAGSQVHISGGLVGQKFVASSGSNVSISGGTVQTRFAAASGSTVSISGGLLEGFTAGSGSNVSISGGLFADGTLFSNSSNTLLEGSEFYLDGVAVAGPAVVAEQATFEVPFGSLFSGFFADGTPFAFSPTDGDSLDNKTIILRRAAALPAGPATINAPFDAVPAGVRSGQTLLVGAGAVVPSSFGAGPGSTVRVLPGGSIGKNFEAVGAVVEVAGGAIASDFDAFAASHVTVTDGAVGGIFQAHSGSSVRVEGGRFGVAFTALAGSDVQISGGSFGEVYGNALRVLPGSQVSVSGGSFSVGVDIATDASIEISGGKLGRTLRVHTGAEAKVTGGGFGQFFMIDSGGTVMLHGGDFRINGAPLAGLTTVGDVVVPSLGPTDVLSGTLADGTPFAFSKEDGDVLAAGGFSLHAAEVAPVTQTVFTASSGALPLGVRTGQLVRFDASGAAPVNDFNAGYNSLVWVEPRGAVGDNLEAAGAVIVAGGAVGHDFDALPGSSVSVGGGVVGVGLQGFAGSSILISEGEIGAGFSSAGLVTVAGGHTRDLQMLAGGFVSVSGGEIDFELRIAGDASGQSTGGIVQGLTVSSGGRYVVKGGVIGGDPTLRTSVSVSGELQVDGGTIDRLISVQSEGLVEINAGSVAALSARGDSVVHVNGGNILGSLSLDNDGAVVVSGGSTGDGVTTSSFSASLAIHGSDFRLNGEPIAALATVGATIAQNLSQNEVLSGTLEDGTPFVLAPIDGDTIRPNSLTLSRSHFGPTTSTLNKPRNGLIAGESRTVTGGEVLGQNFNAGRLSQLAVQAGGAVGDNLEAIDAQVTITGGAVGEGFDAFRGATVNISGGSVGSSFDVFDGAVANISGGAVGDDLHAHSGGQINISGGSIGENLYVFRDGVVEMSGGTLGANVRVVDGGTLNLVGRSFVLDGVDLSQTMSGAEPLTIASRGGVLSGLLADGLPFTLALGTDTYSQDYVAPTATLTIALAFVPGDYDRNGVVDAADYLIWRSSFGAPVASPGDGADGNLDGIVDAADFSVWRDHLAGGAATASASVPEPAGVMLALFGVALSLTPLLRRGRTPSV
ncbi:beta strand repeat-containing protein [Pirellulimonas nuda]|uniref:beta strand repeat-containing protein n=1 Tax=Pirellulimonas nuda TaxID=2528009 RepID=UPI0011A1EED2|nr:hypothetical protein [Pirellulimonas nuda]